MLFRAIELKNFMSYGSQAITDIAKPGLVLLEGQNLDEGGSNGSGKSTCFDAVSWALFGQTVRGLKGDDVINRRKKKDCGVALEFESRGKSYRVSRFRKDSANGDRLFIDVGKKRVELGTAALTQQWLLDELGIDFELFRCTILFAQEETFNFVSATNKEQKDILSRVMRVDYSAFLDKAKSAVRVDEDHVAELNSKVTVLQSHQADAESSYKSEIEAWDASRLGKIKKLSIELGEAKAGAARIADDSEKLSEMKSLREKLLSLKEKIEGQARGIRSDCDTKSGAVSALENNLSKMVKSDGECPACFQPISGALLAAKKKEMRASIEASNTVIFKLRSEVADLNKKLGALRERTDEVDDKILLYRDSSVRSAALREQMVSISAQLATVKAEENPYVRLRVEAVEKQAKITAKLAALNTELDSAQAAMPYKKFWVGAFGDDGIKSFVFDLVCSTLTARANYYLNVLTDGNVTISFDTQKKLKSGDLREKFDCVIHTQGESVLYDSYSGGEKRQISLAVDMALSDLMADYYSAGFNLVVFDEQDFFMDDKRRSNYLRLLQETAQKKRVFVISHDGFLKTEFDEVWVAKKKSGISSLEFQ